MTDRRIYLEEVKLLCVPGEEGGSFLTPRGVHEMWCKLLDMHHEEKLKKAYDLMQRSLLDCYDNEGDGPDSRAITGNARPRHNLDAAVVRYKGLKIEGPVYPECPFPEEVKET